MFAEIRGAAVFPERICANCGTAEGLQLTRARLNKTEIGAALLAPSVGVAVTKTNDAVLTLPLCPVCAPSASRLRPTLTQYMVVWACLVFLLLMAVTPLAAHWEVADAPAFFCGAPVLVATGILLAFYGTRRPRPPSVSYYQPVFIRVGEKDRVIFGFVNDDYAAAFAESNPGARLGSAVRQRELVERR